MEDSLSIISEFCKSYKNEMRNLIDLKLTEGIINGLKVFKLNKKSKELIKLAENVYFFVKIIQNINSIMNI